MEPVLDKRRMRTAFSRQAPVYEQYAHLQREVGDRLLRTVTGLGGSPGSALDIGCGTGYLLARVGRRYPEAQVVGVDISAGMLAQCRREVSASLVLADAESLPLADNRFDLVLSTSTYQWVEPLGNAFGEARRILRPGGLFAIALFSRGTLAELRHCYSKAYRERYGRRADLHPFPDRDRIAGELEGSGFGVVEAFQESYKLGFDGLEGLFRYLKGLGAQNAVRNGPAGLGRRSLMNRTAELYHERYGTADGLPATFSVEFVASREKA